MDHFSLLQPIFSYTAHLTSGRAGGIDVSWADVERDLEGLFHRAEAGVAAIGRTKGEQSLFAIRCWVAEALAGLPGGDALASRFLPSSGNAGSEFFERLNVLLRDIPDSPDAEPETLAAIRVYLFCLELGFRGYYARHNHGGQLEGYRDRCRDILRVAGPPTARAMRRPQTAESRTAGRGIAAKAAAWAAPVAATAALYLLYQILLTDLYSGVVG